MVTVMDVMVLFVVSLAIKDQEWRSEFIIVQRRRRNAQDFLHGWMDAATTVLRYLFER